MLSRNLAKRRAENDLYLKLTKGIREWFLLQKNKWKYRRSHVYRTCPSCRAKIRLKKFKESIRAFVPAAEKNSTSKLNKRSFVLSSKTDPAHSMQQNKKDTRKSIPFLFSFLPETDAPHVFFSER